MLSLPGLESLSPVETTPTVTQGQLSQPSNKAVSTGFSAIFARYNQATGEEPVVGKKGSEALPLPMQNGMTKGQSLPFLRQGEGVEAELSPLDLVKDLSLQLDRLTETIEQLLTQENTGDAPLSKFLEQELGLDQETIDQVIEALNDWVSHPPEVTVEINEILQLDETTLQQLEGLTELLSGLDRELSRWLAQIQPDTPLADLSRTTPTEPGAELAGMLRRMGEAQPGEARDQPLSPARFVAQTLQMVLNSSSNGSIPLSLDMGRPEAALMTPNSAQPSTDVAFNNTLLNMARESLGGKASAKDPALQLASLAGAAEASVSDMNTTLHQSKPELATLDRQLLRSIERPLVPGDMGRQIGERVFLMAQGEIKHATIRLDPPELGMMDIKVSVQNDQTQVQIVVHNPQVREALESQSTRLREFLEQQGLSLENLDVREESRGQGDGTDNKGGQQAEGDDMAGGDAESGDTPIRRWQQGLVDDFV